MNTQERIKIVNTHYRSPNQVLMILLIVLASFGMGLIPDLVGFKLTQPSRYRYPSKAALWSVLGQAE